MTAVLSWFPSQPDSISGKLKEFCNTLTEPVLSRVRKVVPQIGMIDISFIVLIIGLSILESFVAKYI
jgi:YggT family protein